MKRSLHSYSLVSAILHFYLYSSLHIALVAMAITGFSYLSSNESIDWNYIFFIGSSTLLLYSVHRLVGIRKSENYQQEGRFAIIIKYRNHIKIYSALSLLYCLFAYYNFPASRKFLLLIPVMISIAYSLPLFMGKRLRDFPLIKIFLIAICWGIVTSVIPIYEEGQSIQKVICLGIERALFIFAITIPFDIRDIEVDGITKVKTLANIYSIGHLKIISYSAISISSIIAILFYNNTTLLSLLITYIISIAFIHHTTQNKSDYYFTGWIDGLICLPMLMYFVLNLF